MNIGAAEIDITPDFEVELCGFASRIQPAIGVLEPIFARAIFLDDGRSGGNEKLLWIVCDLVALDAELIDGFRAWAKTSLGLEPRQVLLCATHTHNAPATIHLNAAGNRSERYASFLRQKLEQVAGQAVQTRPCRAVAGVVECKLGVDRRNKPSAHVDSKLWTIAFIDNAGDYIAALMNYAMHPVALGHVERRIAPDWCGPASRGLSQSLPGRPITLVTNGAAGNVNPPAQGIPAEQVASYGQTIAACARRAIDHAQPLEETLAVKSITVQVPLDVLDDAGIDRAADRFQSRIGPDHPWATLMSDVAKTWRAAMKRTIQSGAGKVVPIELQAVRIGHLTIVAVNGEMFSRFGQLLREKIGGDLFVVGYSNTAFGYIPTREAYAEGGYEVEQAHFFYNSFRPAPGGLELLVDRAAELISTL